MMTRSDKRDLGLLKDVDRELLLGLTRLIKDGRLTLEEVSKHTAQLDKIRERMMAAEKHEAAARMVRIRARAAAVRRSAAGGRGPDVAAEDREGEAMRAPYGRKDDGTPVSHEEFCRTLRQAVAEIYGVDFDAAAAAGSTKA